MTEDAFRQHIILWGVESAAPQFGTSIATLKGWMRGDSALPQNVWNAWVRWSSQPPEERPPIVGFTTPPNMAVQQAVKDNDPALMRQSALASRVLADPGIAARIKEETGKQNSVQQSDPQERAPLNAQQNVSFEEDIPVAEAQPNGEIMKGTVAFCCPTNRDFAPVTFECSSVLIRNHQMPLVLKSETILPRGRNEIAERLLRTKCEWSFWIDSDMILPFGNADWFKSKTKISTLRPEQYAFDAVKRLMSHHQDLVGAVYASRTEGSQMVIQPDLEPRNDSDRQLADLIRKNQAYGLKNVGWVGFGCVLVHRRVFEAIRNSDPEIRSGQCSFFDTEGAKGEDVRFCERASLAGFSPQLDVELVVGHMGRRCFIPEFTKGRP